MTVLSARDLENREMIKLDYLAGLTWRGDKKNSYAFNTLIRAFALEIDSRSSIKDASSKDGSTRTGKRCLRRYSEVKLTVYDSNFSPPRRHTRLPPRYIIWHT